VHGSPRLEWIGAESHASVVRARRLERIDLCSRQEWRNIRIAVRVLPRSRELRMRDTELAEARWTKVYATTCAAPHRTTTIVIQPASSTGGRLLPHPLSHTIRSSLIRFSYVRRKSCSDVDLILACWPMSLFDAADLSKFNEPVETRQE